jgi:DNA repair exonuclease SbcCD ATPase subunit
MRTASFRIRKVVIEGFKAFAAQQNIDMGDGHLFVFGKNGHGKSSVVEAIRWCLFGLADRPEVEVRNVFYSAGDCKVELDLTGPGGVWKMQRRLRPGTGRSDLLIHNPNGVLVPQSVVFPHIARLGPREGTHIIFASQQASNRRPQADITDFDRVLYSYLRVEEVPHLVTRFNRVLEEQAEVERLVAKDITEVEESLRGELNTLQSRVDEVLRAAPWPAGTVPTNAETDSRIRRFVEECGGALTRPDAGAVTREWLLKEAERAIQSSGVGTQAELQRELARAKDELRQLTLVWEAFCALEQQIAAARARVADSEAGLVAARRDASREQLQLELDELIMRNEQLSMTLSLMQQALALYEKFTPAKCPVCATPVVATDVQSRLSAEITSEAGLAELAAALTAVRVRLAAIVEAEAALENAQTTFSALESKSTVAWSGLSARLDEPRDRTSYQPTADRIQLRINEIERELASAGSLINAKRTQLKNLQSEVRFQEYRSREEFLLQSLEGGLEPIREAHREFLDLLDTLGNIRDTLQDAFNSTLNTTLPKVGELMTDVYGRLTQQSSFTQIAVRAGPATAPRALRVQVTSERTPGVFYEPSEVLNGQAFSALNLVPYFVFSQFQADALELDCLLIDDPSQSFDTSRIELLLRELATAASHAQLIVASHEDDRFEPSIDTHFAAGSYRVLRVTSFTPEAGPVLEWAC